MTATALPLPVAVPTTRRRLCLLTLGTTLVPVTWGTTHVVTTEWLPPDRHLLAATVRALPAGQLLVAAQEEFVSPSSTFAVDEV